MSRIRQKLIALALALVGASLWADSTAFNLDTREGIRVIEDVADLLPVTYRSGETVTRTVTFVPGASESSILR